MEPTRQTLSLPTLNLSYLEWHQGPEPLLLLHGMGDHALVWCYLADFLGDRYHIVAVDMRGHGDSDKPAQGYEFSDLIADLDALSQALGWSRFHGIGHSWTAKLLPLWAAEAPTRLQSMVLVDPFFNGRMPGWVKIAFPLLYHTLSFLQGMGPFDSYEVATQQARQLKQFQGWSDLQQRVFQAGIEQKPDGSWGSKFTVPARNQIFPDSVAVAGLTQPVSTPTLLVQPEQDLNRWDWQLKPYRTYLTNCCICQVPGNHWPFLGEPDPFNQAVATFLQEQGME